MMQHDVAVIGGGAAGYSAAIYARRYGLSVVLVDRAFGGNTAVAGTIENYPGARRIEGYQLMTTMRQQAVDDLGATVVEGEAMLEEHAQHCFTLMVGEQRLYAKALILATGMEHRMLRLPNEDAYRGKGLHTCVTCDGPVYRGKRVAIVGGSDGVVKGAMQLVDMGCAHATIIAREPNLDHAEPVNRERLAAYTADGRVTVLTTTEVRAYVGGPPLAGVELSHTHAGFNRLAIAAVFLAIGAEPRVAIAQALGVRLTARGEIDVDAETMRTNVDGVFAAGDVCDAAWGFKQTITAAAQGAIAATSAYRDLGEHGGGACAMHAVAIPPPRAFLP